MRLLTAFGILGLCVFAMLRGWEVVHFVEARAQAAAAATPFDARPWTGTPGLAGLARSASLGDAKEGQDPRAAPRRARDLEALLAVRPLSSTAWLSLAGMRFVATRPKDEVVAPLAMSLLTGPNEGSIMMERGVFGLLQWENLPEAVQEGIVRDLAGIVGEGGIGDEKMGVVRGVARRKPPAIRSQIAERLRAQGVAEADLARMGF